MKESRLEIRFPLQSKPGAMSQAAVRAATGRLPRVTQVLALAIQLEEMLRTGEAKDYADLARLSCVCRERLSQIARLNYLAPEIQVELLYLPPTPTGRYPISETALRKIASLLSWADQRLEWTALKQRQQLG